MTPDRKQWLERYEDRLSVTALARSESLPEALELVEHLVNQTFTPATPTLMNSGKANTGRLVSCFLLQDCTDNLDSITKTLSFVAELSKGGGGIGVEVSNLRARGESARHPERHEGRDGRGEDAGQHAALRGSGGAAARRGRDLPERHASGLPGHPEREEDRVRRGRA